MNINFKNIVLLLLLSCLLFSCEGFNEKIVDIDVDVEDVPTILVINGWIEKDSLAIVQISYSEDIHALASTPRKFEENANVTITTEDGLSEELEYYGYGWYYGTYIRGEVNNTYTMSIGIEGKNYTASSKMLPARGYDSAWVYVIDGKAGSSVAYSDEWIIKDPSAERNRYLFEWWANGVHYIQQDWCIDDNRVVNANEGLRLFTVTLNPNANEHIRHRTAEIDKLTYDYYNMYEKIVRGIVGVDSQTPYNPVSNFGEGTIGNFRAVAFASYVVLTPPEINANGSDGQIDISFPTNKYFTKYNLYWDTKSGVTKESNVIEDIPFKVSGKEAVYSHTKLTPSIEYFYRIQVEDADGNVSILSPETSTKADTSSTGSGNGWTEVILTPGTGQITIYWDDYDGAKSYVIYWDNEPGIDKSTINMIYSKDESNPIVSPYVHKKLDKNLTYYYRVGAYTGDIILSEEVSAKPE
jgi:hypothetical protein